MFDCIFNINIIYTFHFFPKTKKKSTKYSFLIWRFSDFTLLSPNSFASTSVSGTNKWREKNHFNLTKNKILLIKKAVNDF